MVLICDKIFLVMLKKVNTVLLNFDKQGQNLLEMYLKEIDFVSVIDCFEDIKKSEEFIIKASEHRKL